MTAEEYSAADIEVLEFDESVRKRPGMYFGLGLDDPRLPTQILTVVVRHAFHPANAVGPDHLPRVVAEVTGALTFTVTDDHAETLPDSGEPTLGYRDSLLTVTRWSSAAAAALTTRTVVETWRDGRGFRQELAAARPLSPPAPFASPAGSGTRVAFTLDPALLAPGATIAEDLADLDAHGHYCEPEPGTGPVIVHDLRGPGAPTEHRLF